MTALNTYQNKLNHNEILEIFHDDDPIDPRSWDNLGIMLCIHPQYDLGDEQFKSGLSLADRLKELKPIIKLPLYLLDHSGLMIKTSSFNDPWDSGQIGYIITNKNKINDMFNKKPTKAELIQSLNNEVITYNDYLGGNVYGFIKSKISICDHNDKHKDEIESCFGYYGNIDNCLDEIINFKDYEEIRN